MTTVENILKTFDNGHGLFNTAGDQELDATEIEASGGYPALARAVEQLATPAEARRVVGMVRGEAEQRLALALAPAMGGMILDGRVRADQVYGRRAAYASARAALSPQAREGVRESAATRRYMDAPGTISPAVVFVRAMAQVDSEPRNWLIAAHTVRGDEARSALYQRAIAAATTSTQADTVLYARYAAAMAASTSEERVRVLGMPPIALAPWAQRRWREATALASNDPAMHSAIFQGAMSDAVAADEVGTRLGYLGIASSAARTEVDRLRVATQALAIFNDGRESLGDYYRYAALRLVIRMSPEAMRAPYIERAEQAFRAAPAKASSTLRQLLVEHGSPDIRADIIAGASMGLGKPDGPGHSQLVSLAVAVSPGFDAFD